MKDNKRDASKYERDVRKENADGRHDDDYDDTMPVMLMDDDGDDENDDDDGDGDHDDGQVSSEKTPPAVNEQMLVRASFA